jgi:hypothetical protein
MMRRLRCWLFGHGDSWSYKYGRSVIPQHHPVAVYWCTRCGFHYPEWLDPTPFLGNIFTRIFRELGW